MNSLRLFHQQWRMRLLLEPTQDEPCTEVFCGDDPDSVEYEIEECRRKFKRKSGSAFLWYLRQGTLVTFYRKGKTSRIRVLERYLCNFEGGQRTIHAWEGDYHDLIDALALTQY